MSDRELDFLRAEIGTLEGFLRDLTPDHLIERLGFEHRLAEVREQLKVAEALPRPKQLPVTFRGAPVEGTRSISGSFAAEALQAFIKATDTVAASLSAALKDSGPLPGQSDRSLRIIGTARGSFGFELELPPPDAPPLNPQLDLEGVETLPPCPPDPYARAIETTLHLLEKASTDDEETISDLIAEIHPRAAKKVLAFAKVLAAHDALFAADFEGRRLRMKDQGEVQRIVAALKEEDIREDQLERNGQLLGVLPESRAFEARLTDGVLVRGVVDRAVPDIDAFNAQWRRRDARLQLRLVTVRSRQRYVLTAVSPLEIEQP